MKLGHRVFHPRLCYIQLFRLFAVDEKWAMPRKGFIVNSPKLILINGQNFSFRYVLKKEKIACNPYYIWFFWKLISQKNGRRLSPLIRVIKVKTINHGLNEVSTLNGRHSTPFSKPQSVAEQFSNSWRGSLENCRKSPFWPSLIDVDRAILPRHLAITSFHYDSGHVEKGKLQNSTVSLSSLTRCWIQAFRKIKIRCEERY